MIDQQQPKTLRLVSTLTEAERARLSKASRLARPTLEHRAEFAELARRWRERRKAAA